MSRIDDAMRASGREGAAELARRSHPVNPFVSPWADHDEHEPPSTETIRAVERRELGGVARDEYGREERPRLIPDLDEALELHRFNPDFAERLALPQNENMALVEQFRRLAGLLHHAQIAGGMKVVLITSAAPSDGKTLTAMNLALTLSESYGRNVLLIDMDLRRPSTQRLAQFGEVGGLSHGLRANGAQKLEVVRLTKSLTLLPAGLPLADPTRLITSERMYHIIEEARARFDWVILDAPPLGPVTDASLLLEMADSVLLVVRAGHTRHASVKKAVETLGSDRLFGVVLNAAQASASGVPSSYYSAYKPLDPSAR